MTSEDIKHQFIIIIAKDTTGPEYKAAILRVSVCGGKRARSIGHTRSDTIPVVRTHGAAAVPH